MGIAHRWLVSFEWIACKWLFCLCGIAWKIMMEIGRGGACVPARVAQQGRIHRSIPRAQCVCFWYGNAAARTFGRARRRRPYGFVWADCTWVVLFVGKTVHMNQHHRCCTFDSLGLPTIGGYPEESCGGEPMPSALYFLKSIFVWGNHSQIIHSPLCDDDA